jgi:murein peptide amidase A
MERLGHNLDGYRGERIDIRPVLADDVAAARRHGWQVEALAAGPGLPGLALRRTAPQARHRIYLSTGIHGDEPAGPLAMKRLLEENIWPEDVGLWVCPCLNPDGFLNNRREGAAGIDLNRDYRHLRASETRAHVAWLERQPAYDLTLCLHEDWEARGFYVYEQNPERRPSLAERMVTAAAAICPIDDSPVIDGRAARAGIIQPDLDPSQRPEWPEAFYLLQKKTRLSYTLEAPSDFPLGARVAALVAAVRAALLTEA